MNNDELATRRAQAIAEDRCFSKGRLRDEFRMKPAPGAEPVKWYKNTYGGRFAVYRIADCVPMREKRPLTSKQQLAGQSSKNGLTWSRAIRRYAPRWELKTLVCNRINRLTRPSSVVVTSLTHCFTVSPELMSLQA